MWKRKRLYKAIGLLAILLIILGGIVGGLLKYTPTSYREAGVAVSEARTERSSECTQQFVALRNAIENNYPEWGAVFTSDQLCSFMQEDFVNSLGGDANLPDGFHDLRLLVKGDRLCIGCRYGTGFFSTVFMLELRVWLVANEVNLAAIEIVDLRAGAIPVSPSIILDSMTEAIRRANWNIDIRWYRHKGNPVGVMKFQADRLQPSMLLKRLEVQNNQIVVVGQSVDAYPTGP